MPSRKRKSPPKRKPVCFAVFSHLEWAVDFSLVPPRFRKMAVGEISARLPYFQSVTLLKPKRGQVKTTGIFFNHQLHKVQDCLSTEHDGFEIGVTTTF